MALPVADELGVYASFGSAAFGSITSAGSMRQMQLGGKLLF